MTQLSMTLPSPDEILELWREALPERVPQARGLVERLTNPAELLWQREGKTLVAVAAFRPSETHPYGYVRLLLVHPQWQRRGLGRKLVAEIRERLGPVPLALGEERGHFFSGAVPASVPFWEAAGFRRTGGESVDMRCDLRPLNFEALPAGFRLSSGAAQGALEGVFGLTEAVFSPRWTFDAQSVAARAPQQVLALWQGERVVGFALTGRQDDPAVLPSFLYPEALAAGFGSVRVGGLGPVGLHPDWRGGGLGRALMLGAMDHLRQRGVEIMGIDWTGIAPFYEKLGFSEWARNVHMRG